MLQNRKIEQENLVTLIEGTIGNLERCLTAYREFMKLPLAVQIISERDFDNIGYPENELLGHLSRLDPEKDEEALYVAYVDPCQDAGQLVPFLLPGLGHCYCLSKEMYATLEPVRDFKRLIDAKGVIN